MTLNTYMAHKADRFTLLKSDVKIDEEEFQLDPMLIQMVKRNHFLELKKKIPTATLPTLR